MSAHAHGRLAAPRPIAWWWIIAICAALLAGVVLAAQRHILPFAPSRHAPAVAIPPGCSPPAPGAHAPADLALPPAMIVLQQTRDPNGALITVCAAETLPDTVTALRQTLRQQGWQPAQDLPQDSDMTLAFTRDDGSILFARCYRQATMPPTVIVVLTLQQ